MFHNLLEIHTVSMLELRETHRDHAEQAAVAAAAAAAATAATAAAAESNQSEPEPECEQAITTDGSMISALRVIEARR